MANEKYLNYYIECLTSTMTDCVVKNISMQANAKITDDVIQDQAKKIEEVSSLLKDKQKEVESLKVTRDQNENNIISDLNNKVTQKDSEITRLSNEINELRNRYRDYDSIKNQATHVDTFKNELIKSREETNKLRDDYERKIASLKTENDQKITSLQTENNQKILSLQSDNNSKVETLIKKYDEEKESLKKQVLDLTAKIDYLQLPPAKRKKIDELNKEVVVPSVIETAGIVEDGGTF